MIQNVAIIISDFQQKYVVVKAMRRSGGISKILLMKKLKSKMYVSFQISLYVLRKAEYLNLQKCARNRMCKLLHLQIMTYIHSYSYFLK